MLENLEAKENDATNVIKSAQLAPDSNHRDQQTDNLPTNASLRFAVTVISDFKLPSGHNSQQRMPPRSN
jgi:hypothetical protein